MPVINQLLQKFGYIKLADFGLLLDTDGRVVSLQDSSLIDGSGGRVVGWRAGDVGPAVLPVWPGARPPVATAVPSEKARVVLPQAAQLMTVAVAPTASDAVTEEDEWAWEIALARARAATSDVVERRAAPVAKARAVVANEATAPRLVTAPGASHAIVMQTEPKTQPIEVRAMTSPPPPPIKARPVAVAAVHPPIDLPRRRRASTDTLPPPPATITRPDIDFVTADTIVQAPPVTASMPAQAAPRTIIPVPTLPVRAPSQASAMQPTVRAPSSAADASLAPPRRFPKGTEPLDPVAIRAKLAQPFPPARPRPPTLPHGSVSVAPQRA